MPLVPGYGETDVPDDELVALLPAVRTLVGIPVTRAAVYDLEQAVQQDVAEDLLIAVLSGSLAVDDLLDDHAVRDLHRRLYGDIWSWAGAYRQRELNIGVAPEQIAVQLRESMESIRFRWHHTSDWTAHQLGIAAHADALRIHPFADGNGRATRLLADLLFVAAQDTEVPELYDWALDKRHYVDALRRYDRSRDPTEVADLVGTRRLGE